jgi:hypothetical protein
MLRHTYIAGLLLCHSPCTQLHPVSGPVFPISATGDSCEDRICPGRLHYFGGVDTAPARSVPYEISLCIRAYVTLLPQPELVCFWFSAELPAVLGFWMPVRWANVFLRGVDVRLVTCVACNQADATAGGGGGRDVLWLCLKVAWTLLEYVLWLLWALLLPGAFYSFVLGAVQALPQHSNCRVQSYLGVTPARTFSKVLYFCLYGKAEYVCRPAAFRVMRLPSLWRAAILLQLAVRAMQSAAAHVRCFQGQFRISLSVTCQGGGGVRLPYSKSRQSVGIHQPIAGKRKFALSVFHPMFRWIRTYSRAP